MFFRLTLANVARVWPALALGLCLSAGGCMRHEQLRPGLRDALPEWVAPSRSNPTSPWGLSREARQIEQNLGVR